MAKGTFKKKKKLFITKFGLNKQIKYREKNPAGGMDFCVVCFK